MKGVESSVEEYAVRSLERGMARSGLTRSDFLLKDAVLWFSTGTQRT